MVCIHKQTQCTVFSLVGFVLCYPFQHFTFGIGSRATGLVEGLAAELVKEGEGVQHKVCDSLNSISCIVLKTCTNECTVGGNLLLFTESDWFSTGHLQLEMNSAAITDVSV